LIKRGYYPNGGGLVRLRFRKGESLLKSLELTKRGKLIEIGGVSHASEDLAKRRVSERQAEAALKRLKHLARVNIHCYYYKTLSTGSGITLFARFEPQGNIPVIIGSCSLGKPGRLAEGVGNEAAEALLKNIGFGAPIDPYLADQLLIIAVLSGGVLRAPKITGHIKSGIYVIQKFLGNVVSLEGLTIRVKRGIQLFH